MDEDLTDKLMNDLLNELVEDEEEVDCYVFTTLFYSTILIFPNIPF